VFIGDILFQIHLFSSWPDLIRPSIVSAFADTDKSLRRADARRMGGRGKPGHDGKE
jgi:hypothetical protein